MNYRSLRVVAGALVVVCVASPGAGAVVSTTTVSAAAPRAMSPQTKVRVRTLRIAGSQQSITVIQPSGCFGTKGMDSFIGEGGGFEGQITNYAAGYSGVAAGWSNEACDSWSLVGAGSGNFIGGDGLADYSAIAGGNGNSIEDAVTAFIGGGDSNKIGPMSLGSKNPPGDSAIVAGLSDTVTSPYSFIGAGGTNAVTGSYGGIVTGEGNAVTGAFSILGGGYTNTVSGEYAVVGGGYGNVVSGLVGTVGGGYANTAGGQNSTVPGGASNVASGQDSYAAGLGSRAVNPGTFVWSDEASGATTLSSTASNQFLARASGGFYLYSAANLKSGVKLAPGSGSWSSLSDRASKTDIESVDDQRILAKVTALPVSEWSYSAQGTGVRHLGPMAQDFRRAFGLGEDQKHISAVDEEGVALAAIKALQSELAAKDRKLSELDTKYSHLESRLAIFEKSMAERR